MSGEKIIVGAVRILLGGIGIVLIGIFSGWYVALGVFLCIWGNNLKIREALLK